MINNAYFADGFVTELPIGETCNEYPNLCVTGSSCSSDEICSKGFVVAVVVYGFVFFFFLLFFFLERGRGPLSSLT